MENINVVITTTNNPKSKQTLILQEELSKIIPNSKVCPNNKQLPPHNINLKIVEQKDKLFSILFKKNINNGNEIEETKIDDKLNEQPKKSGRTLIEFKIVDYKSLKQLRNKANPYSYLYPELVVSGFSTDLGSLVCDWLLEIFPMEVDKMGNRVVSFNAKNDFIYFRTNRYRFENSEMVRFQDVGPHLTLRVRKIEVDGKLELIKHEKIVYEGENVLL